MPPILPRRGWVIFNLFPSLPKNPFRKVKGATSSNFASAINIDLFHAAYPEDPFDLLPARLRAIDQPIDANERLGLDTIPLELVEEICMYLTLADMDAARFVSPRWWAMIMTNKRLLVEGLHNTRGYDRMPNGYPAIPWTGHPSAQEHLRQQSHRTLTKLFDICTSGTCNTHFEKQWRVRFQACHIQLQTLNDQKVLSMSVAPSGHLMACLVSELSFQAVIVFELRPDGQLSYVTSVPCSPEEWETPAAVHLLEGADIRNKWWACELREFGDPSTPDTMSHFQAVYKLGCGKDELPFEYPLKEHDPTNPGKFRPVWMPGRMQIPYEQIKATPKITEEDRNQWTIFDDIPLSEGGLRRYWIAEHLHTQNLFVVRLDNDEGGIDLTKVEQEPQLSLYNVTPIFLLSRPSYGSRFINIAVSPEADWVHEQSTRQITVAILWLSDPNLPNPTSRNTLFTYSLRFMYQLIRDGQFPGSQGRELVLPSWWSCNLQGAYSGPKIIKDTDEQTRGVGQMELLAKLALEGPIQGKRVTSFPARFGGIHRSRYTLYQHSRQLLDGAALAASEASAGLRVMGDAHRKVLIWGPPSPEDDDDPPLREPGCRAPQVLTKFVLLDFELGRAPYCKRWHQHSNDNYGGGYHMYRKYCACELHDDGWAVTLPIASRDGMMVGLSPPPAAAVKRTASSMGIRRLGSMGRRWTLKSGDLGGGFLAEKRRLEAGGESVAKGLESTVMQVLPGPVMRAREREMQHVREYNAKVRERCTTGFGGGDVEWMKMQG